MPQDKRDKDFLFIDESGDPGIHGSSHYFLVALQISENILFKLREHIAAFRYFGGVVGEFKNQRWAREFGPTTQRLLAAFAELNEADKICSTSTWLDKATYRRNGGPHLKVPGEGLKFRHFQIRRLLEIHRSKYSWSEYLDVVIDRWSFSPEEHENLRRYLGDNYSLRPRIATITMVDSAYSDLTQVVDVIATMVQHVVQGEAGEEEQDLCRRSTDIHEIKGGTYQ